MPALDTLPTAEELFLLFPAMQGGSLVAGYSQSEVTDFLDNNDGFSEPDAYLSELRTQITAAGFDPDNLATAEYIAGWNALRFAIWWYLTQGRISVAGCTKDQLKELEFLKEQAAGFQRQVCQNLSTVSITWPRFCVSLAGMFSVTEVSAPSRKAGTCG